MPGGQGDGGRGQTGVVGAEVLADGAKGGQGIAREQVGELGVGAVPDSRAR